MSFRAAFALTLLLVSTGWAAEYEAFPDLNQEDPASLREATRVLEEEIKLAAKPQTYLVLDLPGGAIRIKGRGVDLHRIVIARWIASKPLQMAGTFRLIARPPVARRKIDPASTTEQEPIALVDMPTDYILSFSPALRIEIQSAYERGLIRPILLSAGDIWQRLKAWSLALTSSKDPSSQGEASITIRLSKEEAQSLAWSSVDGMALIIRRLPDQ